MPTPGTERRRSHWVAPKLGFFSLFASSLTDDAGVTLSHAPALAKRSACLDGRLPNIERHSGLLTMLQRPSMEYRA